MTAEKRSEFLSHLTSRNSTYKYKMPSRHESGEFLQKLLDFLFPICQDCICIRKSEETLDLEESFHDVIRHLECLLMPLSPALHSPVSELLGRFEDDLPGVYDALVADAQAITENDPASISIEEVLSIYPGFRAIATYRISNLLHSYQVPLLPRMLSEYTHGITGIDIHPGATIGQSFFIDHGTGVVIGETTIIGNNVKIYQGVTLGAKHVTKSMAQQKRHPTIEDNVVIYANATILGGRTTIGHDSVVGGNAWITQSVPPHSMVYHQSQIEVKSQLV